MSKSNKNYSLEKIQSLLIKWQKDWNNPDKKLKILKEIKENVKGSSFTQSEIKNILNQKSKFILKVKRDKENAIKKTIELVKKKAKENKEGDVELSDHISSLLLDKKNMTGIDQATELMVEDILKREKISTLRHDEKPELWMYNEGILIPHAKSYIIERCRHILGVLYKASIASRVIAKICADTYVNEKDFFKEEDPMLVPLKNGILDLKNNKLINFSPKYRFFNKLPVVYDPKADCKKIIKFLKDILENKEDLLVIQELFGFLLVRDYFIEKSFICICI